MTTHQYGSILLILLLSENETVVSVRFLKLFCVKAQHCSCCFSHHIHSKAALTRDITVFDSLSFYAVFAISKVREKRRKAPHCWLLCLIIKVSSSHSKQFLLSVVVDQQLVLLWARPLIPPLCYCVSDKNPAQSLIRLTLSWPPFLLSYSLLTKEHAELSYVTLFKVFVFWLFFLNTSAF